jgi:hypothetical protein
MIQALILKDENGHAKKDCGPLDGRAGERIASAICSF